MKRLVLAGVVAGVIAFVWSALSHMVLHLGETGMQPIPGEAAVLKCFEDNIPENGMFFFPGMDLSGKATPEEQAAWQERYRTGPAGLMVYKRRGGEFSFPRLLVVELATNVAAGLVAAWIVSRLVGGYFTRVYAVALCGLFGWFSISLSYWNWYGFPGSYIFGEGVDQVVGWLLGGLWIAGVVPKTGLEPARV